MIGPNPNPGFQLSKHIHTLLDTKEAIPGNLKVVMVVGPNPNPGLIKGSLKEKLNFLVKQVSAQ